MKWLLLKLATLMGYEQPRFGYIPRKWIARPGTRRWTHADVIAAVRESKSSRDRIEMLEYAAFLRRHNNL